MQIEQKYSSNLHPGELKMPVVPLLLCLLQVVANLVFIGKGFEWPLNC